MPNPIATKRKDEEDVDEILSDGSKALSRRDGRQAEKLFRRAIALDPKHEKAHFGLGMALGMEGKLGDALAEFHKEEDLSPQEVEPYLTGANFAKMLGRTDEEKEQWRKLLKAAPDNRDAALNVSRLLSAEGKNPEAVEVLEGAVKLSPEDSQLQLGLGRTYLRMGEAGKALPHMKAVAEKDGDLKHDPILLNEVAYDFADYKSNLELAKRYAEAAVGELEDQSDDEDGVVSTKLTYDFALVWDTLGWVYFQGGDLGRSEGFVRASWLLDQDPIVGEHLGEIYEKEGRKKEAAQAYKLAISAQDLAASRAPVLPIFDAGQPRLIQPGKPDDELRKKILASYKRLTGKSQVINESWRLPDGTWSKTPTEELNQLSSIRLGNLQASGAAEFMILFAPGKTESVTFLSGSESLAAFASNLKAAHYPVEFPVGSKARIVRRAHLDCKSSAGCTALLMPITLAAGLR